MSNPPISPAPASPKGGMPKWLIILLVILILIVLGCCGGFVTCTYLFRKGAQAATQAAPGLIKSAMNKEGVDYDTTGNGISLPANFPSDVPVYSGMKATVSSAPPGSKGGGVTFTGSAKPQDLADYYARELTSKGWTQANTTTMPSGFTMSFSKDKQSVEITATVTGSDTTMEIIYGTGN